MKTLFDDLTHKPLPHSLVDELTTVRASSFCPCLHRSSFSTSQLAASITRARIELENQIAFSLELDSFYNWLKKLTKKGKYFDQQVSADERHRWIFTSLF